MKDPRKPQRMGVTRKLTGLPPVAVQEKALEDDGCDPIWTFIEYPQAIPSFMLEDVVVAVDERAFGKHTGDFKMEVLKDAPKAEKKPRGPVPKLSDATPNEWAAIRYNWENTLPKEKHATGVAKVMGYDINDDQIRYRLKKEAKEAILNRGKE